MTTRTVLRSTGLGLAFLGVSGVLAGAGPPVAAAADVDGSRSRGQLVSVVPVQNLADRDAVVTELTEAEFDAGTAKYGVDTYRLVYRTIDARRRPTTASGLLALPRNGDRHLRTVSYTHGTEVYRGDAPSVSTGWGPAPAITYASAGFAAVAPDYLGLGVGPGFHPWMDKPSEVTAAVDMLRAGRQFAARSGRSLAPEVLVTGFSQGASAATALGRALQNGVDPWFRLGALAPISGVYDMGGVELPALLGGALHPVWSVGYTAYFLVAWNRLHHLYGPADRVFRQPEVAELFDGEHRGEAVLEGLPASMDDLLTPYGRALLERPTGRLAAALEVLDGTCDWTPRVPTRLYVADEDDQAHPSNTDSCQAALGAPVYRLGPVGHNGSNVTGTAAVVRWFSELR